MRILTRLFILCTLALFLTAQAAPPNSPEKNKVMAHIIMFLLSDNATTSSSSCKYAKNTRKICKKYAKSV